MFDLPSILGEYLLPLLILVPLAIVLVLLATRSHRDEPWEQQRRDAPLPPRWTAPPTARTASPAPAPVHAPVSAPVQAPASAPVPASVQVPAAQPTPTAREAAPAHEAPPPAPRPTPAPPPDFSHTSPFLDADTLAPPPPRGESTVMSPSASQPDPALQAPRRRAADRLPGPTALPEGPVPVLIVDDSAVVRAKLSKLLSSNGYAVTMARHGNEALEQLNQHWFSMMITDLEMPEMDGFELIAHASNDMRFENLPIVAITGHEALQAKVHDAKGLYGIFKKPWNDRELLARVAVLTQLRPRT